MGSVISRDGTTIAFQKSGNGPALVLVHGTTADHTRWAPVLPALESKFAVYALDRRGRGGSGDTEPYNIEREFEDIAVVVDSIGAPVHLLGHSYGALCSLEAALLTSNIQRLILYEPPISIGGASFYSPKVVSDMQALLAKGDRDGVVTVFMREVPKVSEHDLDLLRSSPAWGGRVAAAHTSLREMDWSNRLYAWKPVRFSHLTTPTLLLLGGDSPIMFKTAIDQLHQTLANSQITVMPGQQHVAINSAPDLFLRSVLDFLTAGGKSQD